MPKPIFTIGLPESAQSQLKDIQDEIARVFQDYYVIVYQRDDFISEPKFQVFYEKDFNEVKYEELKQMVLDAVKT